jgi:anti-sigma regulatory factor (Ser/Thr protein kinase)
VIVLEQLDLGGRTACLRILPPDGTEDGAAELRLRQLLERLGVDRIQLHAASFETTETTGARSSAPIATLPNAALVHRFHLDGSTPVYAARSPHRLDVLQLLGSWADAVLATHGPLQGTLHQARLALYELCANTLEHGRPLHQDAAISVSLRIEPHSIVTLIEDECVRFDPLAARATSLPDHVSARPERGYGLHLVRSLVDGWEHRWNGHGNVIEFRKELQP